MSWRRRVVRNLREGDIISPEYNWGARILKVYQAFGATTDISIICDPHGVIDLFMHPEVMQRDIVGPHVFGPNQRLFVWEGHPEAVEKWGLGLR